MHVNPLLNNQPLPKPKREYDSLRRLVCKRSSSHETRRRSHLPALIKKEAARTTDRSSRPFQASQVLQFLPKHWQTHPGWQRQNIADDLICVFAGGTRLRRPSTISPSRPTCLIHLAGSPVLQPLFLDHGHDRALVSTVAAATANQVTNHGGTPRG